MSKNQGLVEKKDNIFTKIFNKIKFFFNKNKYEQINIQGVQEKKINTGFSDSLKHLTECNELIKLQHGIENGTVSIADISEEEAEKLVDLYKNQNPNLKIA